LFISPLQYMTCLAAVHAQFARRNALFTAIKGSLHSLCWFICCYCVQHQTLRHISMHHWHVAHRSNARNLLPSCVVGQVMLQHTVAGTRPDAKAGHDQVVMSWITYQRSAEMHAGHGSSVQHVHWSRAGWIVQRSCHHCLERGSTGGTAPVFLACPGCSCQCYP